MEPTRLLKYKSNSFSQNGEDGVIAAIFRLIGVTTRRCCEFGAFDGVHLSNCRRLILDGWSALMIEGDAERFAQLRRTYQDNPRVTSVQAWVDVDRNTLDAIARSTGFDDLDFLSIDVDGLDYEIFENLGLTPRVVCVEVNAGHDPEAERPVAKDVARENVGQPLKVFMRAADRQGYDLVCYTGNAFFVRRDAMAGSGLSAVTSSEAYQEFLGALSRREREWLYLVNLGLVTPYVTFSNDLLSAEALGLGSRAAFLRVRAGARRRLHSLRQAVRGTK